MRAGRRPSPPPDPRRGSSLARHAAWIPPTLWVEIRPIRVGRAAGGAWQLGSDGPIEIEPTGMPVLTGGETWPLDRSAGDPIAD